MAGALMLMFSLVWDADLTGGRVGLVLADVRASGWEFIDDLHPASFSALHVEQYRTRPFSFFLLGAAADDDSVAAVFSLPRCGNLKAGVAPSQRQKETAASVK